MLLIAAAGLTVAATVYGRAKTDIVVLMNGDNITGKIKELYRGRLTFSTNSMSTVNIEWEDVKTLESQYYFEIEDHDGYKYYGIPALTEDGEVRVTRADAVITLEKLQVIRITPIESSFWGRIDGSVSLGVSYTKGSQIGRVDFALDARYRVEKNFVQLKATSNLTTESNNETIQRSDASLTHQHLFARKVFSDLTASSFRNDEMGIALRLTFGAGAGAHILQTNSSVLESTLGLSINREWPSDLTTLPTNNLEGVMSLSYNIYIYNTPKTTLSSNVTAFPSLPDFDRWRLNADASWSQEIISDFIIVLTFYYDFDSQPASEGASTNDWGFTTSIGYSF